MNKILLSIVTGSLLLGSSVIFAAEEESGAAATETEAPATEAPAMDSSAPAAEDMTAKNSDKFKLLDKNNDGVIDKKEAKADKALAKAFKKIAKKGKLDRSGYEKWEAKHSAKKS